MTKLQQVNKIVLTNLNEHEKCIKTRIASSETLNEKESTSLNVLQSQTSSDS
jgi:hypothetical protein